MHLKEEKVNRKYKNDLSVFKNPLTIWFVWWITSLTLKVKYFKYKPSIRYMSKIIKSEIGFYNVFYEYSQTFNSIIGDFTYVGRNSIISNCIIGKFCSIGPDCRIGLGKHPSEQYVSTSPVFYSNLGQAQISFVSESTFKEFDTTYIGNDVWLGSNVIVIDGIRIGDGAIVAAGAVVTKDVPAYAVVGGIPAKLIRYRFDQNLIAQLLLFKWWDKDIEWMKRYYKKFESIDDFMSLMR